MNALSRAVDSPVIDRVAKPLRDAVRAAYDSGPAAEQLQNVMNGTWLGHPLHPVFTDVPIGAWTTALVLDAAPDGAMRDAARVAIGVGLVGAVAAAATGLTDWSDTGEEARRVGLVHGVINLAATTLFAASYFRRTAGNGSRNGGRACAWAGYALALGAAYLGGDLVYGKRIGVTHAAIEEPESFTAVAKSGEVAEGSMKRARHDDADVLLVRQHGRMCALAHPCAHLGGPLSEGELKDGSVVCPWHGSEFGLEDGHVINGPATQPQPTLAVRERDDAIEVKARD